MDRGLWGGRGVQMYHLSHQSVPPVTLFSEWTSSRLGVLQSVDAGGAGGQRVNSFQP